MILRFNGGRIVKVEKCSIPYWQRYSDDSFSVQFEVIDYKVDRIIFSFPYFVKKNRNKIRIRKVQIMAAFMNILKRHNIILIDEKHSSVQVGIWIRFYCGHGESYRYR